MRCPYERQCPACCRMMAYSDELGSGYCQDGNHVLCARFRRYTRGEMVPVTVLPSGAEVNGKVVEMAMVGVPETERRAATLGGGLFGGALRRAARAVSPVR